MSSSLNCSSKSKEQHDEAVRRSANYHPSVWGDYFLHFSFTENITSSAKERLEVLKEEVKKLLCDTAKKPLEQMNLINNLQRLGVAYHFKVEIEEALQLIYDAHNKHDDNGDDNLYTVALRFWLLRQQGYNVSSDVFMKFKDDDGGFKPVLINDVRGMLQLYEASHLGVQGEYILDEALAFTSTNLMTMMNHLSSPCKAQVDHALQLPLYKGMPRLEARHYISVYEDDMARNDSLLEFAKVDFNLLQSLHQREIRDVSKWWKDLDFKSKLSFARDRLVECYFWILGVYFEPQYSLGRQFLTKIVSITSVIDDIYDVHGTLEELELFTNAIERWDVEASDTLPEYMNVCFLALLDVVKDFEEYMRKEGRSHCVYYAKEAMKGLVRSYFVEANWYNEGYVPTFEECLAVSTMSSGYPMLVVQAVIVIGKEATKEALDWLIGVPKIVRSSSLIARFLDDIQTNKVEQSRGDVASSVQCYMKEHRASEKEACDEIRKLVAIAWKDINEECLKGNYWFPLDLLRPALNFARMIEVLYQYGDGYSDSTGRTKDKIASLLINPINL